MFYICLVFFCFFQFVSANCPNGSIQSLTDKTSCYFFVKDKTNFMAADQYCVGIGGTLVSIHNMFENVFLGGEANTIFTDSTNSDFWTGSNNLLFPGTWSWMDGTPWDFADWDVKQPINVSNTNCGAMIVQSQRWISDDCIKDKPFVCLVKIPETTVSSRPSFTTTPLPHTHCSDGWTYFDGTKYCYYLVQSSETWWDAELTCVKKGSHLLSLHSWEETLFLTYFATDYTRDDCVVGWQAETWIGLYTNDKNAHWNWTDQTPYSYKNWALSQPDNPGVENCVVLWTGHPCDNGTNYVAQINNLKCDEKHIKTLIKYKSRGNAYKNQQNLDNNIKIHQNLYESVNKKYEVQRQIWDKCINSNIKAIISGSNKKLQNIKSFQVPTIIFALILWLQTLRIIVLILAEGILAQKFIAIFISFISFIAFNFICIFEANEFFAEAKKYKID